MNAQRFYNPIVIWLLRSPLRRFADKHTLLLTVTGRKSGKPYTFPVSYICDDNALLVMTHRERSWWKNLLQGAPVSVFVKGRTVRAWAETFTDATRVEHALLLFLQRVPAWRWDLRVKLDANGQPEHPEALRRLAENDLVLCTIQAERATSCEQDAFARSMTPEDKLPIFR